MSRIRTLCPTIALLVGCAGSDAEPSVDVTPEPSEDGAAAGPDRDGATGTGGAIGEDASFDAPASQDGPCVVTDAAPVTYEADAPGIQYTGRFDLTNAKKPRASASGAYVTARFRGSSLTVMLQDESKWGNKNYFDVILDDQPPVKITALPSVTSYEVPVLPGCGDHKVTLMKRTEASIGHFDFLGFKVAELLAPDPEPTRRIEVIGDSITCGSGDEADDGSAECTADGWGQPYQSSYKAYGGVLGRLLGAQRHTTCVSGIGLVRNYSSIYDARTMPEVYDLLYIELTTSPPWDTTKYKPDAIVIGLGTNDFSPGDSARPKMDETTFANGYFAFIDKLKGYYPGVHVFLVSSPMLGDGWPDPTDTFLTSQRNALATVVSHYASDPAVKVDKIIVTKIMGTGCGTHPSADQQAAMADEIAPVVKTAMGW